MSVEMILVSNNALNLALSALDRDANEDGRSARAEMAKLIRESIDVPVFQIGVSKLGFDYLTTDQERILKERLSETINQFSIECLGREVQPQ